MLAEKLSHRGLLRWHLSSFRSFGLRLVADGVHELEDGRSRMAAVCQAKRQGKIPPPRAGNVYKRGVKLSQVAAVQNGCVGARRGIVRLHLVRRDFDQVDLGVLGHDKIDEAVDLVGGAAALNIQ